ncbi:MAG: TRAP transporter TatT component family protein [Gammaproteobacteria bacterium]
MSAQLLLVRRRLAGVAVRLSLFCLLIVAGSCLSGCASIASSAASGVADNLSTAILDQEDPELVREATPAYLILLDSFAQGSDSPSVLGAAAELYAAYGIVFVDDPARAMILTRKSRDYGRQALCAADKDACELTGLEFADYEAVINSLGPKTVDALFSYSIANLAFIRAHSSDFIALADLPKVEVVLNRVLSLGAGEREADAYKYLGVLNSLRPPALGGQPERGREYFEKAISLSDGRDLSAKVELAQTYARLVYDRELHDRLLVEVVSADPQAPGLTLFNNIAQAQAVELLASADDYF